MHAKARRHVHYYYSQDYPVTGTWSVYEEQYVTPDDAEPIDGTQFWVSTHATEEEACEEADRLYDVAHARSVATEAGV